MKLSKLVLIGSIVTCSSFLKAGDFIMAGDFLDGDFENHEELDKLDRCDRRCYQYYVKDEKKQCYKSCAILYKQLLEVKAKKKEANAK